MFVLYLFGKQLSFRLLSKVWGLLSNGARMRGIPRSAGQMSVVQQPARDSLAQDNLTRISGMIFGKPKRSLPWEKRSGGIEIGHFKK
jgi:hypothetical protein